MFCQSQLGMTVEMLVELALLGQLLLEGIDNFLYSTHFRSSQALAPVSAGVADTRATIQSSTYPSAGTQSRT